MGLKDIEAREDDDGDGCGQKSESCSICLEVVVTKNEDRSWAKLHCGHLFHLDCIGSAFNVKGAMQCPNCRKVEEGQWLFANGSHPFPEFGMEDLTNDEEFYDLSYSGMPFGVHWCPFNGLAARLPPMLDDGGFSSAASKICLLLNLIVLFVQIGQLQTTNTVSLGFFTDHDVIGQHAVFAEHATVTSSAHPCPYIAYIRPVHLQSSNFNANVSDESNPGNHWSGPFAAGEVMTTFPVMDAHHSWDHHSSQFANNSSHSGSIGQASGTHVTRRPSNVSRSGSVMQPFLLGPSASARTGSSAASSMMPPYQGSNAGTRDRVQALQAYYQQSNNTSGNHAATVTSSRRVVHRGLAQPGSSGSSSDHAGGFYYFQSGTSSQDFLEALNHFPAHTRERDRFSSVPFHQIERETNWGRFHHTRESNSSIRSSSHHQGHAYDRTVSQNWS